MRSSQQKDERVVSKYIAKISGRARSTYVEFEAESDEQAFKEVHKRTDLGESVDGIFRATEIFEDNKTYHSFYEFLEDNFPDYYEQLMKKSNLDDFWEKPTLKGIV